jgi:hypothetical protein
MKFPFNYKLLRLSLTALVLLILVYFTYQLESEKSHEAEVETLKLANYFDDSGTGTNGNSIYFVPQAQDDEMCESCHEDFVPFEVDVDIPDSIGEGEEFQFNIIVKNKKGDPEHDVEDLQAMVTGLSGEPQQPYFNVIPGNLLRFQTITATFPVNELANEVIITLTGDSGLLGVNNIDLSLSSPEGQSWSSTGSGVEEEIVLGFDEIMEGGFGNYEIEVRYVNGVGQIAYSIYIDVKYAASDLVKSAGELKEGGWHTFSWDLMLTNEELESLGSEVSGTVSFHHEDGFVATHRYTLEANPEAIVVQDSGTQTFRLLSYGRGLGFLALTALAGVTLTGFSGNFRRRLAGILRFRNPQNFHCYVSFAIIFFALIHAGLLIKSHYSLGSTPNLFGYTGLTIFGILAVTGFYRQKLFPIMGAKLWKRFHMILALTMVLLIGYKILTYGGHF